MFRPLVLSAVLTLTTSSVVAIETTSTTSTPAVNPPVQSPDFMGRSSERGTLLNDRFGITLGLQAPWGGGTYNSFNFASFTPTKNLATVEWVEADWYGTWNTGNFNHTDIRGQYPSGTEYYDVEALYFDNDDANIYVAVVTSTPHLKDWGNGNVGVGIYESRISPGVWIRPGDLSLNLGLNAPRVERNGTRWSYDYGVDITHEDRDQLPGLYTMRDNDLGASLYRTKNDLGGSDIENPSTSDWYTSGLNHNTDAYWEHTSFDPHSVISQSLGIQYVGETTVSYYEYPFPGGALENGASTYVVEVTIPRALLGADNPDVGDSVGIRWVMGCRNDGNSTQAVIKLWGIIDGPTHDFGDAPDPSYPTFLSNDGARHLIDGVTFLGERLDAETDGQPDAAASGDDLDGNDDEDGVVFTTPLVSGLPAEVTVTASVPGVLNAWIDFNRDGDWADAGEQILSDQGVLAGSNEVGFFVPMGASDGVTYARFRFSTATGLSFDGEAPDGEVEDYQVVVGAVGLDFGDAPDPSYPTLLARNGACHVLDGSTYLGMSVDDEPDGLPDPTASGDDSASDDEDGVVFATPLRANTTATVQVTASVAGILNAWIDFNADGDWTDVGEQVFVDRAIAAGLNTLTFVVPASVTPGPSFARFRFNTTGGLSFTGLASNGEVEDYLVELEWAYDLGDAPDPTFPTRLASDGARHVVDGVLYLGTRVDADADGQPNATATGDDNDGSDDEDGVTFGTITPGSNTTITVRASAAGLLNTWIDWNRDGDWADAGEQVFTDQALVAGVNSLSCFVPQYASSGYSYARFRFCSSGGLSFDGAAPNGEVEDYRVTIDTAPTFIDWGDAPDPAYPTLAASDGARHTVVWTTYLGSTIDGETDGQPTLAATGDDVAGPAGDDEDGVTFTSSIVQGAPAGLTVVASVTGILNAWVDFNRDGDWDDAGEQIFTDQTLAAGANTLTFWVPPAASLGVTFARFRFSTVGGLTYTGLATDGEVEDYQVAIEQAFDWGDAPDPAYPTLQASNGARHAIDWVTYLGGGIDAESDGQPSASSDGDDLAGSDDEDGVTFTSLLVPGQNASVTIEASTSGALNAWIDFNGDGDWDDPGEQVFVDQALASGANDLTVSVPWDAQAGITYARFRFATTGGLGYAGNAGDGEVEDYRVTIEEVFDFGDAPDPTFPTLLTNNGARHVVDGVTYLGTSVDAEANGQPSLVALGDDMGPIDDEDGVTFTSLVIPGNYATVAVTASVAGMLNAWIDFNGDGDWDDSDEQIFTDRSLTVGPNNLQFWVPLGSSIGMRIGRFRFSTVGGLGYSGLAPNGEVEDHAVSLDVPVELGSFSATVEGTSVVLTWVTHSENENLGYRIYRSTSTDGSIVLLNEELVPGAGTSLETHEYSFVDRTVEAGTTYLYTLADVSTSGVEVRHGPLAVSVPALPMVPTLQTPSPHPASGDATFAFAIPRSGPVRLAIYDVAGRQRRVLVDQTLEAGWHSRTLDAGLRGDRLGAGVYVVRLQTEEGVATRQIVITD